MDVVALNEVDFSNVWSDHIDQAEMIAEAGGYQYRAEQTNINAGIPFVRVHFGNAILSRYPITSVRRVELPPFSEFEEFAIGNHDALLVEIRPSGDVEVRVLAVHLEARSKETRVACAREILKLKQESEVPLFVLGDFNSTLGGFPQLHPDTKFHPDTNGSSAAPSSALSLIVDEGRFMTAPTSKATPADFTFPTTNPQTIIDWVLVPKPWTILERTVLPSPYSDHRPVVLRVSDGSAR